MKYEDFTYFLVYTSITIDPTSYFLLPTSYLELPTSIAGVLLKYCIFIQVSLGLRYR
jgi:hypothetical protein